MKISTHISQDYDDQLNALKDRALTMGKLAEAQFFEATKSFLKSETDLAKKVSKRDPKVNKMEIDIDNDCAKIIATRQPAAVDLRLILMVMKTVTDLERIGDEAEKIANFARLMATDAKKLNMYKALKCMVGITRQMLADALSCYDNLDAEKALETAKQDAEIDSEFESINRLLSTYMVEDMKNIEDILKVSWCARSIERVGDHAKNICEYVVYAVRGKDIRHRGEQPENEN